MLYSYWLYIFGSELRGARMQERRKVGMGRDHDRRVDVFVRGMTEMEPAKELFSGDLQ